MKIISLILASGFSLVLLGSCKNSGTSAPSPGSTASVQDLYPLKIGDSWTYHRQVLSPTGSVTFDTEDTLTLPNQITFQGQQAFQQNLTPIDTIGTEWYYYNGSSDIYSVHHPQSDFEIAHYLHYPMKVGESFILADDSTFARNYDDKTVLVLRSSNESVTVPAGSFSCVYFEKYGITTTSGVVDTEMFDKLYYASGVGLVMDKGFVKSAGVTYQQSEQDLVSFMVK
ncbi:MAG: hypothetical protein Q8916_06505 [Bacteroidota bacterium]|nr:hypothetical protein [Bacteroidota bacterium]MDP4230041.1 hypothetical protein [Bacteroidota bacterium]MDP4236817.1 hypothetical protein [Bacteroidota bacterium]